MKLLRMGVAVLWLICNLVVLGAIFGVQSKTGYCLESYPPQCKSINQFGWPEPWLSVEGNSRSNINNDAIRQLASLYVLFLAPSLAVAVIIGKVLHHANPRD